MSDLVLVALITAISTTFILPIVTHILGQRDRALASDVVRTKDTELTTLRSLYDARGDEISRLRALMTTHGVPEVQP